MEGGLWPLAGAKRAHARCIQDLIKRDIVPPCDSGPGVFHLKSLHRYSVGLRSKPVHAALGDALSTALLDLPLQRALEESGSLNWCATEAPLYALKGDGLLDAVAMSMWGVPDTDLSLRTALYNTTLCVPDTARPTSPGLLPCLTGGVGTQFNHSEGCPHCVFQPGGEAWDHVIRLLEPRTRDEVPGDKGAYLHVHLFLLANVIRRAIVVLSEHTKSAAAGWASNQGPAGVYLPLLWDSADCYPYPVVLGSVFPWRRFAPLVTVSSGAELRLYLPVWTVNAG
uniref:Uncharacterized protein n=1 Tax=Scleropages formosus TaxID=113540 RepID=A0A8C9SPX0_SCLFO